MLLFVKKIKNSCPYIWNLIESINGFFIKILYFRKISNLITEFKPLNNDYVFRQLSKKDVPILVKLIENQPFGFDNYFKPHSFDFKTFSKILSNGTYVMIGVFYENSLIGYCFLRLFINRTAYRGKLVDKSFQGRGIGTQMGGIMNYIASKINFRVFATISKDNIASLKSAKANGTIKIIKELSDNYLYIEILNSNS